MTLEASRAAAVILAAGLSRRFAGENKLLAGAGGKSLIAITVGRALAQGFREVIVVTGYEDAEVRAALEGLPVRFAHNPDYAAGMGGSIAAGIAAVSQDCEAALIILGDMPAVKPETVTALIGGLNAYGEKTIAVPVHHGRRGNPVLWRRTWFADLQRLSGDIGGRPLIAAHGNAVLEVEADDPGIFFDIDDKAALDAFSKET